MNQRKFLINLNSVESIKQFIKIVTNFTEDIDIISGRFKIDAKSIMGIFALDLAKPVEVEILSDESDVIAKFSESISEFKVQ